MKKTLLFAVALSGIVATQSNAQLSPGSYAKDFTFTAYQPSLSTAGLHGNGTYKLYEYLDSGYTVFLDVSATWCGPCWTFHTGKVLDSLYKFHGPLRPGHPGVDPNSTNNVMVFWLDGDRGTADATMLDGAGAIGNWINPTGSHQVEFPMGNPAAAVIDPISTDYNIGYFPTLYKICPDRRVTEMPTILSTEPTTVLVKKDTLYAQASQCPPVTTSATDASLFDITSEKNICEGPYTPKVRIQNYGTTPLTAAAITVTNNGTTVATGTFSGLLNRYEVAEITCTTIPNYNGGTLVANVTMANDMVASNNQWNSTIMGSISTDNYVKVVLKTDQYPAETYLDVRSTANPPVIHWKEGNEAITDFGTGNPNPPTDPTTPLSPNTTYTWNVAIPTLGCSAFVIGDFYGDGMTGNTSSSSDDGQVTITNAANSSTITINGGDFATAAYRYIKNNAVGLQENTSNVFSIFPNPAADKVTVSFEAKDADYAIEVLDMQGRKIKQQVYSNLSGNQQITVSLDGAATGNYIMKITANGTTSVQKFAVK